MIKSDVGMLLLTKNYFEGDIVKVDDKNNVTEVKGKFINYILQNKFQEK